MPIYTGDKFGFGKAPDSGGTALDDVGEAVFPEPGQYDWVCPPNVTSVSVVCVGGGGGATADEMGGGGGGGLAYKNNIPVTAGQTYKIQVGAGGVGDVEPGNYGCRGGDSWFIDDTTVKAQGGGGTGCAATGATSLDGYGGRGGADNVGDGEGNGGNGGDGNRSSLSDQGSSVGGGGAGGYGGDGGRGGDYNGGNWNSGTDGAGGGGGGGYTSGSGSNEYWGGGGGGVSIYGAGRNGKRGDTHNHDWQSGGEGGSGGTSGWGNGGYAGGGNAQVNGGQFGGGGGTTDSHGGYGGSGAVRIIWGYGREFPSSGCDDYWSETITRYTAPTAGDPTTTSSNWFRGGCGHQTSYGGNQNDNGIVPNVSGHDNLDGSFTLEGWFYCERLMNNTMVFGNSWGGIIMSGRPHQTDNGQHFGSISLASNGTQATGPYRLQYHINGTNEFVSDYIIPQSTWTHFAITRKGTTEWDMWINGKKEGRVGGTIQSWTGSHSTSTIQAYSDRPVIGGWGYGGRMQVSSFFGNISNLRLVKDNYLYDNANDTYTIPSFPLQVISGTDGPNGNYDTQFLMCGVDDDYEKDLVNARVWSGPNCMPSVLGPGAPTATVVKKGYRIWGRHRGLGGGTKDGQNGDEGHGGLLSTWKKSTGSFQTEQFSTHGGWSAAAPNADGIALKVMPAGAYAAGDNAGAKWDLRTISYGVPTFRPRNSNAGMGPFIQNVQIKVMAGQDSGGTVLYDSGQFTLRIPSYNYWNDQASNQYRENMSSCSFEIELPNGGVTNLDMDTWYSVYIKGLAHPNVNNWNSVNGTPGSNNNHYWYSEQPVSYQSNSGTYNMMRWQPTSTEADYVRIRLEQATFNDTSWANNNHGDLSTGQFPFFGISMNINTMKDPYVSEPPTGGGGGSGGSAMFTHSGHTSNDIYQWTCPTGVTQVRAVVIGGGGGGGQWCGGGGGGAAMKLLAVVPGQTYQVQVGKGGDAGTSGSGGGESSFMTLTGGGGYGGHNTSSPSSGQTVNGGSGSGGTVNGTGGKGYPSIDNPLGSWGYLTGPDAAGTNGAAGGGGGGSDNQDAMHGGAGSYYAGGGGGGGSDNGNGGTGGDGGSKKIDMYWYESQGFGGGGGGTDGSHLPTKDGGPGGTSDGKKGSAKNWALGGGSGGFCAGGGWPGGALANGSQNGGGGAGGAFGGGGGASGHWDTYAAGGGGGGLVYLIWGPGVTDSYDSPHTLTMDATSTNQWSNDGTTWSNLLTTTSGGFDISTTQAFDGNTDGTAQDSDCARTSYDAVMCTLDLSGNPQTVQHEIYVQCVTGYSHWIEVTVDGTATAVTTARGAYTFKIPGQLTKIRYQNDNSGGRSYLEQIRIDGIYMQDGVTGKPTI